MDVEVFVSKFREASESGDFKAARDLWRLHTVYKNDVGTVGGELMRETGAVGADGLSDTFSCDHDSDVITVNSQGTVPQVRFPTTP